MADLFTAAPPHLGWSVTEIGQATCFHAPGVPVRELNRVHGAVDDPQAVLEHFGGDAHVVCGGDETLGEHGYREGYAWMKFAREPDPAAGAPTELVIEQVGPQGGRDFAVPVRTAFGMPEALDGWLASVPGRPGWSCLVAYLGDRAVGAGALFVDGDEAWCGFGGTLPEARGRGAQSAILARRVALAAEQGATTVTTETGVRVEGRPDRSYRNILRAGFQEAYERPNWDSP